MKRSHFLLTSNWMSTFYAALCHTSICSHSSHKTSRYTFQESENHWSRYQLLIRDKIGSEFAFGIIPCEPVTQREAPVRGLQGSNWRQNKMHCCGIPPPTRSPCSLARVYSSHGCWGGVRARLLCVWSARICQCTCVGAFPVHSIIHFSPCHSFAPFFVLIFSIPPTLFWSLSSFLSHSLSVTKTCTCTHLSAHARSWHGRVPENQHGLAWGYAKKYKNRCGTTA